MSESLQQGKGSIARTSTDAPTEVCPITSFQSAKPHFYVDANRVIDTALKVFNSLLDSHQPYGIVDIRGRVITQLSDDTERAWLELERHLANAAGWSIRTAQPSNVLKCSYLEHLDNIDGSIVRDLQALQMIPDELSEDMKRLLGLVYSAAISAPALIVNLLRRMPDIAQFYDVVPNAIVKFAQRSVTSMLYEPLRHPQQYAKPFVFCLGEGYQGDDYILDRSTFLPRELIERYTMLDTSNQNRPTIRWSHPTNDFTLRTPVSVADRTSGHERQDGDHVRKYPVGTRLGDIVVTEPTIGCPGEKMAYAMVRIALRTIVGERLWERS